MQHHYSTFLLIDEFYLLISSLNSTMNKGLSILFLFSCTLPDFRFAYSLEIQFKGEQFFSFNIDLALSTGPGMAVPMLYVLSGCAGTIML